MGQKYQKIVKKKIWSKKFCDEKPDHGFLITVAYAKLASL